MTGTALRQELETGLRARTQARCFVCGAGNERGLRIRFARAPGGEVRAGWVPEEAFEGFRGIVHGGVVSTVLDEAMSKAVAADGVEALTAELRVRFRHHVSMGARYEVRGWIVKRTKRLIETEASLVAGDGTEYAHAWGRFLALTGGGAGPAAG